MNRRRAVFRTLRLGTAFLLLTAVAPSEDRMAWFREAKFGMFVHWGPYSALGGEWNGHRIHPGDNAEWIMERFHIPVERYRELAREFRPDRFDARAWARLARQAGVKYLVYTAKHHDGFAMYHSAVSPYNIVEWGGFGRDPLQELAAACREEGVRLCIYYSHREDWDDPDAYGNNWDYREDAKNFERYLERKSKPQLRELLTRYGPVGLVWFDRGMYTPAQATDFVNLVRSLQPQCLVNGRVGNYDQDLMGDYQNMSDNGMPAGGLDEYWETPQTLNGTWGYNRFDQQWKSPQTVIRRLVEVASRGGNYLLNIGPDGTGSVPEISQDVLRKTGAWLERNGESIYGTGPSPFGNLPWGACTVKGSRLYLHVFEWPRDGELRIPALNSAPVSAWLLADRERRPLAVAKGTGITVKLPPAAPDAIDTVVVLEVDGAPRVTPVSVVPANGGGLNLDYMLAATYGKAAKTFNRKGGFHIARWTSPDDRAVWRLRIAGAGRYRVRLTYAAQPGWEDGQIEAVIGTQVLRAAVRPTGDWYEYRSFEIGEVAFAKAGDFTATLRPARTLAHNLVHLRSVELIRVDVKRGASGHPMEASK
ncbi:MAG TPA: alpha-L-fucosidase [Bryobacteraceae bacterium]|nr:alpha-L-fucosidase [Bryobacteraceae bacterium]